MSSEPFNEYHLCNFNEITKLEGILSKPTAIHIIYLI